MFLALAQDLDNNTVKPLAQYNKNLCLSRTDQYRLISNICPHQNSRIACDITDRLQCPYHALEYTLQGQGIGHKFELHSRPCYQNQTMLFEQPVDCEFPVTTEFMTLVTHREDIVRASPDIIMDVFLDVEHIPTAHRGVYDNIGITSFSNLKFKYFTQGSLQVVPIQGMTNRIHPDDLQYQMSACWMAVYPGTMIEWQPGALFVTVAMPDPQGSKVQVYKYRDTRYSMMDWSRNTVVWETAWEQDRALSEGIVDLAQENIDDLKQHHRDWMCNAV